MDFSGRQQEPGKKFTGLGLVILFHVFLGWALMNGLGNQIVKFVQKPMQAVIEPEVVKPPPDEPPPPPPPKPLTPPPPFIPPPEVQVQQQAPSPNAITTVSSVKPESNALPKSIAPVATETVKAAPVVISAKIDFQQAGCKPEYPRASLRNEETGTTTLSVVTGADGAVTEVNIIKSSGFRGLDNAVRAQLLSGSCKNKPGTVDGKPQATITTVQYLWSLDG
jgi:protein TonB